MKKKKTVKVSCEQCEMFVSSYTGVPTHATGCPSQRARWDGKSKSWIKQDTCRYCGHTKDAGTACCED